MDYSNTLVYSLHKIFIFVGIIDDIATLNSFSEKEKGKPLVQTKAIPGHRTKFIDFFSRMKEVI